MNYELWAVFPLSDKKRNLEGMNPKEPFQSKKLKKNKDKKSKFGKNP